MLGVQLKRFAFLILPILILFCSGCFKMRDKTVAVVETTFDKPAGRYNPMPAKIDIEFADDIDMETVGESDFLVRGTCGVTPILLSKVEVHATVASLFLLNTSLCAHGDSVLIKLKYSGIKFVDENKKAVGSKTFTYVVDTSAPTVSAAIATLSSLTMSDDFIFTSVPAFVTYTFSADVDLSSVIAADFEVSSAGATDCATMPTVGTLVKNSTNQTVRVPLVGAVCGDGESFQISLLEHSVADTTRSGSGGTAPNLGPPSDLTFGITYWGSGVSVTSVGDGSTSANGTYRAGETVDIAVTFDSNVVVTGNPRLQLNVTGGPIRYAQYLSGSPGTEILFRYVVVAGDEATDLDAASASALQLNGGTISLAGSNGGIVATRTLPAPGAPNSLSDLRDILIDTTGATITSSSPAGPTDVWTDAGRTVTFTFSEDIDVASVDDADLTINAGTCAGVPTVTSSGVANNVVSFTLSSNTCVQGENYELSLDPASVQDLGGTAGLGVPRSILVTTDVSRPLLTFGAPSVTRVNMLGTVDYALTISGATSVTLSDADVQVAGASTGCLVSVTGSGLTSRTVSVTGCSDDGSVQLSVNAGTATNAIGNLADAVDESSIVDFDADNTSLTDPTASLVTLGSNLVYNLDSDADFTLTFAADVLGGQAALNSSLTLECNAGSGSNPVSRVVTRTSDTVVTVAPFEASADFVYGASCTIQGVNVPDLAGNLHDFAAIPFRVNQNPVAVSGPSGSLSLGALTSAGEVGNVVFNVSMDPSTLDGTSVTLTCNGQSIPVSGLNASLNNTSFVLDFDESDSNWTALTGGETCTVAVGVSVTNSLGTALSAPASFDFDTTL